MSFTPSFKGTVFPVAAKLKPLASEVTVQGLNIAYVFFLCRLCELNAATLLCCEGPSAWGWEDNDWMKTFWWTYPLTLHVHHTKVSSADRMRLYQTKYSSQNNWGTWSLFLSSSKWSCTQSTSFPASSPVWKLFLLWIPEWFRPSALYIQPVCSSHSCKCTT